MSLTEMARDCNDSGYKCFRTETAGPMWRDQNVVYPNLSMTVK